MVFKRHWNFSILEMHSMAVSEWRLGLKRPHAVIYWRHICNYKAKEQLQHQKMNQPQFIILHSCCIFSGDMQWCHHFVWGLINYDIVAHRTFFWFLPSPDLVMFPTPNVWQLPWLVSPPLSSSHHHCDCCLFNPSLLRSWEAGQLPLSCAFGCWFFPRGDSLKCICCGRV